MPPLLEVQHVWKDYDDGSKRVTVLKDISFEVARNDFVCIVGPSGCGKSTLLRLLTGLDTPTKGTVLYEGAPIRAENPKVTMVFQSSALMPWLTVRDNVALGLEAQNWRRDARWKKADEIIATVGLAGFETAYPRELSGGMRQRVGVARAIATDPTLLCMDEPFSALDALTSEALREEVLQLWADPSLPPDAVVMVTHNVEEAVYMADRILVMGARPGVILRDEAVKLPRPRDKKSPEFYEEVDRVYKLLV
ncbi:MAG: ABC transporter ATP-binding protein [Thermoplasmatota archaeon]